ncbi:hypothetical protein COO60DRAFT_1635785 [Scenedesmus sp. NREL 46B-D3]|nr:hypothetical protein COO60DRAFT_1635785 [Scenedesmus sp. NREL 46B-D3]
MASSTRLALLLAAVAVGCFMAAVSTPGFGKDNLLLTYKAVIMLWQCLTSAVLVCQQAALAAAMMAAQSYELILASYQKQLLPMLQLMTFQSTATRAQLGMYYKAIIGMWPHALNVVLLVALIWPRVPLGGWAALRAAIPHAAALHQAAPLLQLFAMQDAQACLASGNLAGLASKITGEMMMNVRAMPCLNINQLHGTQRQHKGLQAAVALALLLMHPEHGLTQQQASVVKTLLHCTVVRSPACSWSAASGVIYSKPHIVNQIEQLYAQVLDRVPEAAKGRAENKYAKVAAFMMVARVMHYLP